MRLDVFSGRDLSAVCAQARAALGEDALIVHTRSLGDGRRSWIEVEAAAAADVAKLVGLVKPRMPVAAPARSMRDARHAHIIALVGPTGSGKTTTLAKLAMSANAFGAERPGIITLDTLRAGAYEQLNAYAQAAGIACELVYDRSELAEALKRLAKCDVILVDTPGRGPRMRASRPVWHSLLKELRPNETHLVVPATMRTQIMPQLRAEYSVHGLTHTLLTKLDEAPADSAIASTVAQLGLHARWITDGQNVPGDLHAAGPTVLGTLGIALPARAFA